MRIETTLAARLPRESLARGRTLSIIEGSFATAMGALTGGTILTGFALWLGAGPFQIGLLTSLPAFAALVQLLAPYFTEKRGERKSLVVSTVAGQRLLWLAIAAIPFLVLPPGIGIWLLIGLVTVSSMLGAIGGIPWLSWMGDLVPKEMRGRYFAARNLAMGVVGLILGPLVGQFLDLWKDRSGTESAYGFVILFVAGVAFGVVSLWLLQRIAEPSMVRGPSEPFLKRLRLPWQNVNFRRFIFFRGYYVFVVNLAGPFFTVFLLQQLGLSFGLIYILNTISTLSNLVSLRWWGPLCDRWGTKKVMVVTTLGKGLFPLTYVAMAVTSPGVPTPATWVLLVLSQVFSVMDAGLGLASNNMQLNIAPKEHNTAYLATYAAAFNLCSAISPLIAGVLLNQTATLQINVGPWSIVGYQALFLVSGLLRISSLLFARGIKA